MHPDARLSRRGFLALSSFASAGLIFNVGCFTAQGGDSTERGESFKKGLQYMRKHGRPGIVIVVPDDPDQRAVLADQLLGVFPLTNVHGTLPKGTGVLLEAAWLCASAKEVGAEPGETLVLLNPDGKRSSGAQANFAQPASVHAAAEKLLAAGRSARARKEAENPQVEQAIALLAKPDAHWEGVQLLRSNFDSAASAVLFAIANAKDAQGRESLEGMLNGVYWERLNAGSGFPYGVTVRTQVDEPDPCPPCGMAAPSIRARKFLGFFSN